MRFEKFIGIQRDGSLGKHIYRSFNYCQVPIQQTPDYKYG